MKKCVYLVWYVTGLWAMGACNPQPEASDLLVRAESLMDKNPDSAMLLIDSIFYPEKSLNREQYMQYLVTKVQAKYKTYRNISEDTLMVNALDHFTRRDKDSEKTALAHFYSGCVYREQGNYEQAMLHYKDAKSIVSATKDTGLQGLIQYNIGDLFAEQGLYVEALKSYQTAEQLYLQIPEKQAQCLSAVGRMYALLQLPDSAFSYFHKGLELAEATGDKELQSLLAQNLSVVYRHEEQYDLAETYLRRALQTNRDPAELPRYYLNFAEIYSNMGRQDSAAWYTQKLEQEINIVTDNFFKVSAYAYLAEWEKAQLNYEKAFLYQDERMEVLSQIMDEIKDQSVYDIQQKYDYEQMQNRYNQRIIGHQQWIILLLAGLLLAAVASLSFFRKMLQEKTNRLKMFDNVQTLQQTTKDLLFRQEKQHSKDAILQEALQWKLEVLQGIGQMKSTMSLKKLETHKSLLKELDTILYGKNTNTPWAEILETIEQLNPGLSECIRNTYPTLSDTEYNVCLLSYAGLDTQDIASVLTQSINTIYKARTNLRKKIGNDFCSTLRDAYQKNRTN